VGTRALSVIPAPSLSYTCHTEYEPARIKRIYNTSYMKGDKWSMLLSRFDTTDDGEYGCNV
jgi:hypothetical protein